MGTAEKVQGSAPLTLDHILSNLEEIENASKEKEITITHKRLNADFTFLVPHISELAKVATKDKDINIDEVYKAVAGVMVTKITEEMLKALKVGNTVDAMKKLFTEDEIMFLLAELMQDVQDTAIIIKKQ